MPITDDPFDLARFIEAQNGIYAEALAELLSGKKRSHWMWFVFPQMAGLGFSAMSRRYAICSVDEARAYLAHPVLGPRLRECCAALLGLQYRSAHEVFGSPDDMKLQSSVTLFELAAEPGSVFSQVLERYYGGRRDERTLQLAAAAR